jgi:S1-C subfamily serine protease
MNAIQFISVVACVALLSPSVSSIDIDKNLHTKCLYPTVLVEDVVKTADGTQNKCIGSGSGVIIKSKKVGKEWHNLVLTCNHVVDLEQTKNRMKFQFGVEPKIGVVVKVAKYKDWSHFVKYNSYNAYVYSQYPEGDMALLLFKSKRRMPVADLALDQKLYIGNEVMKVGCGLGDLPRVEYGRITCLNPICHPHYKGSVRTSAHTIYGDSGGPVFYNNRVVGLAASIRLMSGLPVFNISYFQPTLTRIPAWNKEEKKGIEFMYNKEAAWPVIPFIKLKLERLKPNKELYPQNRWETKIIEKQNQVFELARRRVQ